MNYYNDAHDEEEQEDEERCELFDDPAQGPSIFKIRRRSFATWTKDGWSQGRIKGRAKEKSNLKTLL
ncbi:hypothetical protein Tco_0545787 [Tanacetum coccineum]